MSSATALAGIALKSCVFNASGPRSDSRAALLEIAQSDSSAVLTASATLDKVGEDVSRPRGARRVDLGSGYCAGSIYSEGASSQDIHYYTEAARSQPIAEAGKPFILSVSSSSVSDCLVMLDNIYASSGIAAVELNLASTCASGKSVVAYDFQQMESTLSMVCSHVHHGSIPLGVKLAPYFDDGQFDRAASILAKFPIRFIVCSGAIGQGLAVDAEQECEGIEGAQGIGKMAGGFLKHIALANVRKFFLLMQHNGRPDIDIVGVGGVHSGEDAFELLLCGASAVQVGTCHWAEGPPCFRRINSELLEIMRRKGYSSLEQFRGRLEHFSARPASLNATKSEQGTDGKRILLKLGRVELIDDNRPGPTAANNVLLMIIIVITAIAFHFFQEAQKCS